MFGILEQHTQHRAAAATKKNQSPWSVNNFKSKSPFTVFAKLFFLCKI